MNSLVRHVMTTEVVTVEAWTPFRGIVARLAEHRISAAPVLDATGACLGSSPRLACCSSRSTRTSS